MQQRARNTAILAVLVGSLLLTLGSAKLFAAPKLSPKPQGAEIAFVAGLQADLGKRFATIAEAEKAGYFRYTNEDNTGSISYANLSWTSADPAHPSQLWYDVHGNFLGADFSVPFVKGKRPTLWGVNPARWMHFGEHLHYILRGADGKDIYHGTSLKKFVAAGGSATAPAAATLVSMGLAKSASDVVRVFVFPNIWDLVVWVKPNPSGAFADMNPLVKPSKGAGMDDGM